MKKTFTYSFILWLMIVSGLAFGSQSAKNEFTRIECLIQPTERGGFHQHDRGFPHVRLREGASLNWSGYVTATKLAKPAKESVSKVSGTWIVPDIFPSHGDTYSSIWVGIDGFGNGTVEQIGTEHDWINGSQQHFAWFEMYPRGAYLISGFPVDVGDEIFAEVKYLKKNTFQLSIYNVTKRIYSVIPTSYTKSSKAKRSSAEWIVEAPYGSSGVLPLANFVNVTFRDCSATIRGVSGSINNPRRISEKMIMTEYDHTVNSYPSNLSRGGDDFHVIWEHE